MNRETRPDNTIVGAFFAMFWELVGKFVDKKRNISAPQNPSPTHQSNSSHSSEPSKYVSTKVTPSSYHHVKDLCEEQVQGIEDIPYANIVYDVYGLLNTINSRMDRAAEELEILSARITAVEEMQVLFHHNFSHQVASYVHLSNSLHRLELLMEKGLGVSNPFRN